MKCIMFLVMCIVGSVGAEAFGQSRLDIEKVAETFNAVEVSEGAAGAPTNQVRIRALHLQRFRVGQGSTDATNRAKLDYQLKAAIAKIERTTKLSEAQREKLRFAGEIDGARFLAEMNAIREDLDPRNRQKAVEASIRLQALQKELSNLFRPKREVARKGFAPAVLKPARFDLDVLFDLGLPIETPKTLFERTLNTMRSDAPDVTEEQVERRKQLLEAEINGASETLERQWRKLLKQRGNIR